MCTELHKCKTFSLSFFFHWNTNECSANCSGNREKNEGSELSFVLQRTGAQWSILNKSYSENYQFQPSKIKTRWKLFDLKSWIFQKRCPKDHPKNCKNSNHPKNLVAWAKRLRWTETAFWYYKQEASLKIEISLICIVNQEFEHFFSWYFEHLKHRRFGNFCRFK